MDYKKNESKQWAKNNIHGHWTTMVTPFTPDDEVDEKGLRANVRYIMSLGTNGLGFNWSMGEFWSLTLEERKRICETVVNEARGKAFTGCHIGSMCVKDSVELAKHAQEVGADIALLIPPTWVTKTEQQVYEFVKYIADRVEIGIAYTNWPPSGVVLSPKAITKLVQIPNVCAVKEAHGNIPQAIETHRLVGDKIVVSAPYAEIYFYAAFEGVHQQALFADPEDWLFDTPERRPYREFLDLATKGDMEKAKSAYQKILPYKRIYSQQWEYFSRQYNGLFPLTVFAKAWGEIKGMAGGHVRPPLPSMTPQERQQLESELEKVGLSKSPKRPVLMAGR